MAFDWNSAEKFTDFAEDIQLEGSKVSLESILNKKIAIIGYKIGKSKLRANEDYLTLQIIIQGSESTNIVFTGSRVLTDQITKYESKMPFVTTIQKVKNYYSMT